MATSPLQHTPSLSLDLSLGGLFSGLPKIPRAAVTSKNGEDEAPPLHPSKHPRHRDSPMYNMVSPSYQSLSCTDDLHPESPHDSLKRRKGLIRSEGIKQCMRARREEDGNEVHGYSTSLSKSSVTNSGNFKTAYCLPYGHSSLELDRNMRVSSDGGSTIHRLCDMKQSIASCCTSFVHPQAVPLCTSSSFSSTTQKAYSCPSTSSLGSSPTPITPSDPPPSSGAPPLQTCSNSIIINNILRPAKRKFRRGDEEGKSCDSSSSELLDDGDNLDKQLGTTEREKLVTELETPACSRCASNSQIVRSMGSSAAIISTYPFAMGPIQVPFSVPVPWGYTLPSAMHDSSHMMPPLASEIDKSGISVASSSASNHPPKHPSSPFVPASASGLRSGVPETSLNEGKRLQETFCEDNCELLALSTPSPSAKRAKVHETILGLASDDCASATSEAEKLPLRSRIRHKYGSVASRRATLEDGGNASSEISSDGGSAAFVVDGTAGKQLESMKNTANVPRVSIACAGPSGKTIHGVLNIIKGKQVCLICSCHGTHMTPSQFVQHSGSTDLSNPERSIIVTGFSWVQQTL